MNWVGGSRNRLVMKNDAKRQREFFEKRKMQTRLKNLGMNLPASPQGNSSGSMDLVNLFIVNQIAAKKESAKAPPKVAVLGNCKGGRRYNRNEPLVLPMSPCSPSQLNLAESQPQCSLQGTSKRKYVIPQGFPYRQLSPVQESAFSDHSASDYLPPLTNPLSPFSYASPASSGLGTFPLQLNLQQGSQMQRPPQYSPSPWGTAVLEHTEFQCFSQSNSMSDCIPWSCGSNPHLHHPETPTTAQGLFGILKPDQSEDREPMLDFTLSQSENEQQIEEEVFRGFSAEECEATHFGREKMKIYLKDETPVKSSRPQTVPDSQCCGVEFPDCADVNLSCLEHNGGLVNGCDCSPSYSCSRGYLSSNSSDDEECCQPGVQAASSFIDADNLNPKQRYPEPRLLSSLLKPNRNLRDDEEDVEKVSPPDKTKGSNSRETGSHAAQFHSPRPPAQTRSSEPCKCKAAPGETRDAGTQTAAAPSETRDASTQCSFAADGVTRADVCPQPVDVPVQHAATGRQADTATEQDRLTPSPGKARRSGGKHFPWSEKKPRAGPLSGSGKLMLQRPINPFLDAVSNAESRERTDERGEQGSGLSSEAREEVTPATRAGRLSAEAETLQEVADILLLLKQMRK